MLRGGRVTYSGVRLGFPLLVGSSTSNKVITNFLLKVRLNERIRRECASRPPGAGLPLPGAR